MNSKNRHSLKLAVWALFLGAVLIAVWMNTRTPGLPEGFAVSNGRIEATEVDIATKVPGRIEKIHVQEGDFVKAGQVLADMDTRSLVEQLREAEAEVKQAESAVSASRSTLAQRQSEKAANQAIVQQREAEYGAAQKRSKRSQTLVQKGATSVQQRDDDQAASAKGLAALEAARAQVMASQAAIESATANIIQAETRVEAAKAKTGRIQADIDDSQLKAPLDGRIQYRVAEPGEVLAAGGRVLNMVNLQDVYMTFFLPTLEAGRVSIGSEVHLVLDAAPELVLPARATYVASVAQFTPKTVETDNERLKLMFRIKARIDPELLSQYLEYVKTGLPGKAFVQLDPQQTWPDNLQIRLPK